MTMLDPKGIEAACAATALGEDECGKPVHLEPREAETAIRAYLSTVTPAEVGGLVERLNIKAGVMEMGERIAWGSDTAIMREAATALAAKDAELAEARADALKVGDQMFAEKFRADRAEASRNGYAQDAAARADECDRLRAQLAEANKALDALGTPPSPIQRLGAAVSRRDWHEAEQAHEIIRDIIDAARRAREQGGENG